MTQPAASRAAHHALLQHRRGDRTYASLLRVLIDHDDWFVAAEEVGDAPRTLPVDGVETAFLFTGEAAVEELARRLPGGAAPTVVPVGAGADVFAQLHQALPRVQVDAGSPHAMAFEGEEVEHLRHQALASVVELALREPEATARLCVALGRYPAFRVVMRHDGGTDAWSFVTSEGSHGGAAVLVFTAPDCVEAWFNETGAASGEELTTAVVPGGRLFQRLPELGLPYMLFNPAGPPPRAAFKTSLCRLIASLA